ncbi:MAG: hypothetical protein JWR74_3223 [Polaromonas sp.]|nr:hypothetical protein [Polaromonas sp.]
MSAAKTWMSKADACEIALPFGSFEYRDAQGDSRHAFANAVIERHERIRAAAPELLVALQACLSYGSMTGDEWVTDKAYAAIAKATGETK